MSIKRVIKEVVNRSIDEKFASLVKADYQDLMARISLASTQEQKSLLLMQSIQGHAINGHGLFLEKLNDVTIKRRYVNCTLPEVIRAIDKQSANQIANTRYKLIRDVISWIDTVAKMYNNPSKQKEMIYNKLVWGRDGKPHTPLMGINLFEHTIITNPIAVLQGMYLGSHLDSAEWRGKTEKRYNTKLHKGICIAVNMKNLKAHNISIEDLATNDGTLSYENMLDFGIITEDTVYTGISKKNEPYVCGFYELQNGPGVSDDAAFITVGLKYGIEAALGFLIVDEIDTIDKFLPKIKLGGEDEQIGDVIKKRMSFKLGITDDDILEFIYLSRKPESQQNKENNLNEKNGSRLWPS